MKRLLANLSHELRTPLAAILNTVAIIEHSEVGAQEREHLERLRRNSRHLLSMVERLLEIPRGAPRLAVRVGDPPPGRCGGRGPRGRETQASRRATDD